MATEERNTSIRMPEKEKLEGEGDVKAGITLQALYTGPVVTSTITGQYGRPPIIVLLALSIRILVPSTAISELQPVKQVQVLRPVRRPQSDHTYLLAPIIGQFLRIIGLVLRCIVIPFYYKTFFLAYLNFKPHSINGSHLLT